MSMPSYKNTKKELIEIMRGTTGTGSREFDIAKAILNVKHQEDMKRATWALAIATCGLIGTSVTQIVMTLK